MSGTSMAPAMEEKLSDEVVAADDRSPNIQLRIENVSSYSPLRKALNTDVNSPTESNATEFYDAHEEFPFTPERPVRRSSPVKRQQRAESAAIQRKRPWSTDEENSAETTFEASAGGQGSTTPGSSLPKEVAEFLQNDDETGGSTKQGSGVALRHLFPSKESMLKSEDRRSSADLPASSAGSGNATSGRQAPLATADSATARRTNEQSTIKEDKQFLEGLPNVSVGSMGVDNRNRDDSDNKNDESSNSSGDDEDGEGDETSTASGTVESGDWESGHGFDEDSVVEDDSRRKEIYEESQRGKPGNGDGRNGSIGSPETVRKKNSLLRVLDNARTRHSKMMAKGRKRAAPTSSNTAGSPTLDSSTLTSPEDPQTNCEAMLPPLAVDTSSPPGRNLDACVPNGMEGSGRCTNRGSKGAASGREPEGPPEVKVQQHGRGGSKEDGWRSMHMVQCLSYHEGPVWTVEFNRHGTRLATAGQDGKVVVWNLSVPGHTSDEIDDSENFRQTIARETGDTPRADELDEGIIEASIASSTRGGSVRRNSARRTESESGVSSGSAFSDDLGSGSVGRRSGKSGADDAEDRRLSNLKVLDSKPIRVYSGHKSDVVDLSWSHSDFLCSASIDHTVMLWHPAREERLGTFRHPKFVTAVRFHPWDDHVFLTGCFDKRLRLWTIPDGRVANWVQCQDMITAANFSPDGQLTTAGLNDGRVIFYHTAGLRYYTQIHCKNRHGSNRRGKKVTGLAFVETAQLRHRGQQLGDPSVPPAVSHAGAAGEGGLRFPGDSVRPAVDGQLRGGKADSMSAQYSLLSTTNDSRLRVYDLDNFAMTSKFKGLVNDGMQIKASFSDDGKYVISGSEDGQVYIWNSKQGPARRPSGLAASIGGGNMGGVDGPGSAAVASAGRVKSRRSSSFSVQSSIRPKIATVAAFFPSAALHAVLENWEFCGVGKLEDCGEDEFTTSAIGNAGVVGKEGVVKGNRGWRASRLRRSSAPVVVDSFGEVSAVIGDEGEKMIRLRRRRWSFTGQGRLGSGSVRESRTADKHYQEAGNKACMFSCKSTAAKRGAQRRFSLSPVPGRGSKPKYSTPAGRSPGASSTTRRSEDRQSEEPAFWGPSQSAESTTASEGSTQRGRSERRGSGQEGMSGAVGGIRAVVTADYNGELKVFIGFGEAPL